MAEWLRGEGVTQVAMESTGVYWKPIFNILESDFQVLLVNARDLKHVPGHKTDVKDCQWIAQLLQHGLLKGSFIPPREQRELRDLTRQRAQVIGEHSRISNRIQKVLEDANIKLGSVASDVVGASGRRMLQAIIGGETNPETLADFAKLRLRKKIPQLQQALEGKITGHHRWLLGLLWDQLRSSETFLARLDERIEQLTRPQQPALKKLDAIPGIDRRVAEVLLAEIGADMTPFPSHGHLASWAGICPGNHESAGKKRSGKTTKGSRWFAPGIGPSGLGRQSQERQLLPSPRSEPDAATGPKARLSGGRPLAVAGAVPHVEGRNRVPGSGARLSGSHPLRTSDAVPHPTIAAARPHRNRDASRGLIFRAESKEEHRGFRLVP